MPSRPPIRSSNDTYLSRSNRRKRKRTPEDALKLAETIGPTVLQASPAKRYRYTDLRGEERIEMLRMAQACGRAAMTNFEAAQYFGVTEFTLTEWMAKDPEFALAIRIDRHLADERVERALYHRALGYAMAAEEIKITEDGTVHRAPIVKQIPPDVGAAIFWLKNRMPHLWKDKIDVSADVSGSIDVNSKAEDPRLLAMAVLDVLQAATYQKIGATIDGETVSPKKLSEYTDAELEKMDTEELDRLFREDDQ
jgi:hypothetical protein